MADFKFAIRSLRKTPGFTLLAILVMALGIGANTAVFSVVNTVLLKPLAYRDPDRIVTLRNFWIKSAAVSPNISGPDFHDWHDQSSAFDAMAYYDGGQAPVLAGSASEYAETAEVTPEFFQVMGTAPIIGRLPNAQEHAVVISASYWRRHFGGNANALGQTLRVSGNALPIVGVLANGFQYPNGAEIWFPAETIYTENHNRDAHNYRVIGRMKPGVSLNQAQSQMSSIAARLEQQYPVSNQGKGVVVDRMRDTLVGNVRTTLYLLLGSVALVLLIACANMANLLLAKSTGRAREIAIRAAMGASRGRIVRQLIVESMVLSILAGIAGLILAVWGADALVALAPSNIPRLAETHTDVRVLAFTLAISVASSLLFGLVPALQMSRIALNDTLKQGARTGGTAGGRVRNALVVAEIAFSVVLLTGAGLLVRSFQALMNVDQGYRPEKLLVVQTSFPAAGDDGRQRAARFYDDVLRDVRTIPGIAAAGASVRPPGMRQPNGGYWIDHLPPRDQMGVTSPQAVFSVVAPGTFDALGIALKGGRDFTSADRGDGPYSAIVNEALAKKAFPGQDPIGRVIFCGLDSLQPMKIVGVVGDVRQFGPETAPWPEIYMPNTQHTGYASTMTLLLRTGPDPMALSETVRRKIREHSAEVPAKLTTMELALAENVAAPRFRTLLLAIFAGLAVCLAMAGVYGVMAYAVSQRSNEIGLRIALGARAGDVLRMILGQGLMLAAIGLAIGLAGAVAVTRLLSSMLFEVKPTDPLTYAAVAALLAMVTVAACYVPARRAARVDPFVALRRD